VAMRTGAPDAEDAPGRADVAERLHGEYVLPLRWTDDAELADLTRYLAELARLLDVTVVDGSPDPVFAAHARAWEPLTRQAGLRHVRPHPAHQCLNGKVAGVVTGVRGARWRRVVVADDDVRYDPETLREALARLEGVHVVQPQNVLTPTTWHARWDTGRTLLNRVCGTDPPGTLVLDRDAFVAMGGYSGDVLFENLELVRTVRAAGGTVRQAPDLYVTRRPPSTRGFLGQRQRQAYDSLAQPLRLAVELALLPAALVAARRRPGLLPVAWLVTVVAAEIGRRRHGGRAAFDRFAALWAPLWVAERAVCAWTSLWQRARGGMPYRGRRLRVAAHAPRALRRRHAGAGRRRGLSRSAGTPSGCCRPPCS
jgi:hypothetical protein